MGNEKSNSYWETELPPSYDRVGIENFICAKYAPFISHTNQVSSFGFFKFLHNLVIVYIYKNFEPPDMTTKDGYRGILP